MSDGPNQESNAPAECLLQDYLGGGAVFDEMEEHPAQPRPHWRGFMESLQRMGKQELVSRWEIGRRILREHGVTYNVYGDPQGMDRPWGLDLVPFLINAEEWGRVQAGLIQRARLFNLILADIYGGSQRLLRDGFLPPELIYANPSFLRPCRGIPAVSEVYLHMHACDLGRSPDGQWWVLSDRTQAPSGAGYAWENRTVVSRIFPDEIRDCNVQRLGGFFRQQREMLLSLAPSGCDHPSVVLLTPGPHNETYFEHAYLARHLGFGLVEGADLTVRDRRVFLRTIEGLQPVDVILRRVDDSFCDPLELRSDSMLGVPGLVEAARAGNVTVANALGAGLMESPAFLAFLPTLCWHLLGAELSLPSLATWWCGQPKQLRYVLDNLRQLNVKPAFTSFRTAAGHGVSPAAPTTADDYERLAQRIKAAPRDFVAQERMKLSQAPVWTDDGLATGSIVLRAYVAHGGNSYTVMPGGLTRVSRDPEDLMLSMQNGVGSKDSWVLSSPGQERMEMPRILDEPRTSEQPNAGVPSRTAEHLFWLGRYTERLEQMLRIIRCILGRIADEPGGDDTGDLAGLSQFIADLGLAGSGPSPTGELSKRMVNLLYDPQEPGATRELLERIRFIASTVRDRFSGDMWRILGRLDADGRARPGRLALAGATALSHKLVLDLAAFNGVVMENMTRGRGWHFLDFGRRLERGLAVMKLLRAAATTTGHPSALLEPVLEIADSVMTYRRRYFASPQWPGVLELLVVDRTNPRSLVFQLEVLRDHAAAMLAPPETTVRHAEESKIQTLAESVRSTDLTALLAHPHPSAPGALLQTFDRWAQTLFALSDEITSRYFVHTIPRISA